MSKELDKMIEIAENYLGEDLRFCSLGEMTAIFKEFGNHFGKGVPGGAWLGFESKVSKFMIFEDDTWDSFTEDEMYVLFEKHFDEVLKKCKSEDERIFGCWFAPIQMLISQCCRKNYVRLLTYVNDHTDIGEYDLDRVSVLIGIQNHNKEILEFLCTETRDSYREGGHGHAAFFGRFKSKINEELGEHGLDDDTINLMIKSFKWINSSLDIFRNKVERMSTNDLMSFDTDDFDLEKKKVVRDVIDAKIKKLEDEIARIK